MLPKIIIAVVITALGFIGYNQYFAKNFINKDILIKGDYNPNPNKTLVFKNNSTLTIEGNAIIKNPIECQNGSININVKGDLSASGKLDCQNADGVSIALSVGGNVEFTDSASITTSGHILLVDNPDYLPRTEEDLEKLFLETGMDTDDGKMRIGPFAPKEEGEGEKLRSIEQMFKNAPAKSSFRKQGVFELIKTASARDDTILLNGNWKISPPKTGANPIFFVNFPGKSLEVNGSISLPRGKDAETVKGSCEVNAEDIEQEDKERNDGKKNRQKDAARIRFRAERVTIGDFTINLGDGGKGANTETNPCSYAVAVGGTGGESGNLKITADTEIAIRDKFTIIPGKGGRGGDAKAIGIKGNSGNPGDQGGHALAAGGYGADNIKKLKSLGDVKGLDKIFIGPLVGGDGGNSVANPGDGGDGDVCDSKGGNPGQGLGEEGLGGAPFLEMPPQVKRTEGAKDELGKDGEVIVNNAKPGKDGPPCDGDEKDTTSSPAPLKTDNNAKLTAYLNFTPASDTDKAANANRIEFVTNQYSPPYTFNLKIDNKIVWQGTISENDCKQGQKLTSCDLAGYKYDTQWNKHTFDLNVYNNTGKRLTGYSRKSSNSTWRPSCTGANCPPPFIAKPLP